MTMKTHEASRPGPTTLDLSLPAGRIRIHAGNHDRATITVSTPDTDGPSAEAVNNARIDDTGTSISVNVRQPRGVGNIQIGNSNVQINHGGGVFISGNNFGVISTGSGFVVNGRVMAGGTTVSVGSSPILIEAWLPAGSSLNATGMSTDVEAAGDLNRVEIRTVSGDINLGGVSSPDLVTTSGDITVEALSGSGRMKSVSGDVRVTAVRECSLRVSTISGDVRVSGARVDLDASSVSGRVRNIGR